MLKENAILSEIAKDKRLNEDSRNPGKYFQLLQNMENIDAESWNATKNQAVRDAMVRPFVQEFWDKYKEEMDINTDGVVTNAEMAQYYAKLANDYGDSISSLQNKTVGNVATTAQAANVYMANQVNFSAGYTSLIEASA